MTSKRQTYQDKTERLAKTIDIAKHIVFRSESMDKKKLILLIGG